MSPEGRYQAIRALGHGVQLAQDTRMQRWVVLKACWSEAELQIGNLGLNGLARLLDQTEDGQLVFEYCQWPRLSDYLNERQLDRRWTRKLAQQLIQILEGLHQQGWLHGDLQPDNILVSRCGSTRLIDLSAAHPINTPALAYHPDYAPPEVLTGTAVNTSADVYSLGGVLEQLARRCDRQWFHQLRTSQLPRPEQRCSLHQLAAVRRSNKPYWPAASLALILNAQAPGVEVQPLREQFREAQAQPLLLRRLDLGE